MYVIFLFLCYSCSWRRITLFFLCKNDHLFNHFPKQNFKRPIPLQNCNNDSNLNMNIFQLKENKDSLCSKIRTPLAFWHLGKIHYFSPIFTTCWAVWNSRIFISTHPSLHTHKLNILIIYSEYFWFKKKNRKLSITKKLTNSKNWVKIYSSLTSLISLKIWELPKEFMTLMDKKCLKNVNWNRDDRNGSVEILIHF